MVKNPKIMQETQDEIRKMFDERDMWMRPSYTC
jgi:hypothetical protein